MTADQKALDDMIRWINEYRTILCSGYCTYDDKKWDCNESSKTNIIGALMLANMNGGNLPDGFVWRDYDNNQWPVTASYMAGLAQAIGAFYTTCYHASWAHKANVSVFTTIDDILNYDYTNSLWPSQDI